MAGARNRRHSRPTGNRRRQDTPGWVLLLAGLLLGALAVAAVLFVRDRMAKHPQPTAEPAVTPAPRPPPQPSAAPPEKRFEFYEMLPNFEVVVPEEDRSARPDKTPAPIAAPGVYVLQAGSFGSFAEADKMKAELGLLGVSSQIQKITVDERVYHRVRIGPIEDLAELNRIRQRLRDAKIEALLIRVGE